MNWGDLVTGLGLAAVIEGLVLVLSPRRIEEVMAAIAAMPVETRRLLGLGIMAFGVFLVWLVRG